MTHELVIRGGRLVDGSGGEPVTGALAIDSGTITAVGVGDARRMRELDEPVLIDGEVTNACTGTVLRHRG